MGRPVMSTIMDLFQVPRFSHRSAYGNYTVCLNHTSVRVSTNEFTELRDNTCIFDAIKINTPTGRIFTDPRVSVPRRRNQDACFDRIGRK